ncbi:MAG: heme peroxidase family protein [Chloroflexota bacterium]|nr:heme peroxidase family protein [Chloroflexota bacterium]
MLRTSSELPPASNDRFDFLFPDLQNDPINLLPAANVDERRRTRSDLRRLGETMLDTGDAMPGAGDSTIPAIYTYFGQFIDHDITLENTSGDLEDICTDPNFRPLGVDDIRREIRNARNPVLDLDSVYDSPAVRIGPRMQIGNVTTLDPAGTDPTATRPTLRPRIVDPLNPASPGNFASDENDVPREGLSTDPRDDRAAKIGDPRNDENTVISQIQVAFLRAHNAIVDFPANPKTFEEARTILRQHYQHIIIHDYLKKRIADPAVVDDILANGNQVFKFGLGEPLGDELFMPLEFSVAAFRFGHTMVRSAYNFNVNFTFTENPPIPATLRLLFTFTALSGQLGFGPGTPTLPENWIIEWEMFLKDKARRLDTRLVEPLFQIPDLVGDVEPGDCMRLATRNLLRGYLLRLPTGQAVATELMNLGVPNISVLTPAQISGAAASATQREALQFAGFLDRTPLWFYILAEADVLGNGNHLGPVGSRIVAEVLIELIRRSSDSILNIAGWTPSLPSAVAGTFDLADLLKLAGVLHPNVPNP